MDNINEEHAIKGKNEKIPKDVRVDRFSVPGGWIYIISVRKEEGDDYHTTSLSTCYVPGHR